MRTRLGMFSLLFTLVAVAVPSLAQSFYPERLEDPTAVYLTDEFGMKADGVADDTDALQRAIDAVADRTQQGILFIPQGRYRITHTLYVWPGIRILGYGSKRPVLVLAPNTPGFVGSLAYMVMFTGARTGEHRQGGRTPHSPLPVPFPGT